MPPYSANFANLVSGLAFNASTLALMSHTIIELHSRFLTHLFKPVTVYFYVTMTTTVCCIAKMS